MQSRRSIAVVAWVLALAQMLATPAEAARRNRRRAPPAPPAPAIVQAKASLQVLVQAYVEGDTEGFMRQVDRGFFGDDSRLRQSLLAERRDFSQVRLDIIIDSQFLGREHCTLALTWNRGMVANATGVPRVDQGRCRLVFTNRDGKLVDLTGDRPFGFAPP